MHHAPRIFAEGYENPAFPMRRTEQAKAEAARFVTHFGERNRTPRGRPDITPALMVVSDVSWRNWRRPFIAVPPPPAKKLRLGRLCRKARGETKRQSAEGYKTCCFPFWTPGAERR